MDTCESRTGQGSRGGAGRGGRTPMRLPSADFESAASASSAIPAWERHSQVSTRFLAVSNNQAWRKHASRYSV